MLTARLRHRCPSAQPAGVARLDRHDISFNKPGLDGSGKAMIFQHESRAVFGVVFSISETDIGFLDAAESHGSGYARVEGIAVQGLATRQSMRVFSYAPIRTATDLSPFDWYRDLVVAGAREHELPSAYIELLEQRPALADPELERPQRLAAIKALNASRSRSR